MDNPIGVVRLNRLDGDGSLKAFCDVSLFSTFIIKGLRIVEGKNGLFVGMPRSQGKDGVWYENVRPLNREVREAVQAVVLEAYAS